MIQAEASPGKYCGLSCGDLSSDRIRHRRGRNRTAPRTLARCTFSRSGRLASCIGLTVHANILAGSVEIFDRHLLSTSVNRAACLLAEKTARPARTVWQHGDERRCTLRSTIHVVLTPALSSVRLFSESISSALLSASGFFVAGGRPAGVPLVVSKCNCV